MTAYSEFVDTCPRVRLHDGWEAVLSRSSRGSNFRRRLKKLERLSRFEFRSVNDGAGLPEAFERFLRLHRSLWQPRGFSALSGSEDLIEFHRGVIENMTSTRMLRFDEIWAEGDCIGSIYGFDVGQTFYYYNIGYDPDHASLSPGLVLLGLSIKNAAERGANCYDLLRGAEKYKYDWADDSRDLLTIHLVAQGFRERAWVRKRSFEMRIKSALKNALPESLTSQLHDSVCRLKRAAKPSTGNRPVGHQVYE